VAAALANDAGGGGQAQAAAFALGFGGEERLEQMVLHFLAHAGAAIANGQ
jgi:hypothetical protein